MSEVLRPVLVTGGAGYIGSHAVLALKDAGWPVVVIDNLVTGFRQAVPDGVPFHQADIGDAGAVRAILAKHGIGAIMHFAGSIIVPESVENPLKYYDNNTARSRVLIAEAVAAGVPHIVFSSTAAVYGTPDVVPIPETAAKAPINPYGRSKLMTEGMLGDVAAAHPISFAALRYFNVAGADPDGRSGQATAGATHLIKVAVEAALGKRGEVAVFGTDFPTRDGTGVRDYIHVSDLAAAHVLVLRWLIDHPGQSVTLNCGYNRGFSVLEVLDTVDRVVGRPVPRRIEGRRAGDPAELVADTSAIHRLLDWQPRFDDLATIVAHALAWEQRLGAG